MPLGKQAPPAAAAGVQAALAVAVQVLAAGAGAAIAGRGGHTGVRGGVVVLAGRAARVAAVVTDVDTAAIAASGLRRDTLSIQAWELRVRRLATWALNFCNL